MAERRRIELPFPLKGVDRGGRFSVFDPLTTRRATNVTPYDTNATRVRGGQRDGLRKPYATDIGGKIRFLDTVDQVGTSGASSSTAVDQNDVFNTSSSAGEDMPQPPWSDPTWVGLFSGTMQMYDAITSEFTSLYMGTPNDFAGVKTTDGTATDAEAQMRDQLPIDTTEEYTLTFDVESPFDNGCIWRPDGPLVDGQYDIDTTLFVWVRLDNSSPDGSEDAVLLTLNLNWDALYDFSGAGSHDMTVTYSGNLITRDAGVDVDTESFSSGNDTFTSFVEFQTVNNLGDLQFVVTVNGANVKASWNGHDLLTASGFDIDGTAHTNLGTNARMGFGCYIPTVTNVATGVTTFGFGVSNMNLVGTATSTAAETQTTTFLCASADGEFYSNDGTDATLTQVGSSDILQSDRWLSTAEYQQKLYIANHDDSTQYPAPGSVGAYVYDPSAGTVSSFAPTNFTVGTNIFCVYRDALTAGGNTLPNSFHIGPQGDPTAAWTAGTNPGDPVVVAIPDTLTALIPHSDDLLVVGGSNTIHVLKGHPNSGGTLDVVSNTIGVQSRSAWAYGPKGDIYFLSRTGLYLFRPGDMRDPQPLSKSVLPHTDEGLYDLNPGQYEFLLGYDPRLDGIWIFCTDKQSPGVGRHYFYSIATGGFFKQTFDSSVEPYSVLNFQSRTSTSTELFLGSADGNIRRFFQGALDDDSGGTTVSSDLMIGPFPLNEITGNKGLLHGLEISLGSGSASMNYDVLIGIDPEALSSFQTGTLPGGRGKRINVRAGGAYAALVLQTADDGGNWRFESCYADIASRGRVRVA